MMWFKAMAATLAVLGASSAARAEPQQTHPLAGMWRFQTIVTEVSQCKVSGRAMLRPAAATGRYDVHMEATERCEGAGEWSAVESCVATERGADVRIQCTLIQRPSESYLPDDFVLTKQSLSMMQGMLVSGWDGAATWWRDRNAPVS
jgi:hypothetical protein